METQHWKEENGELVRVIELENFVAAVRVINKLVLPAEEMNHHPDVRIYDYKQLEIRLSTHSEGKVTQADHDLAAKINALV